MLLMSRPMQVKPADEDTKIENRKVFVGMLGQVNDEKQVRSLFDSFGNIEECHILRDANGKSKGCAFIRFSLQQDAINAIHALNGSIKMTGASSSLVVRFADSDKDRQLRKLHQSFKNATQQNSSTINIPLNFQNIVLPNNIALSNNVTSLTNNTNNAISYGLNNGFFFNSTQQTPLLKNQDLISNSIVFNNDLTPPSLALHLNQTLNQQHTNNFVTAANTDFSNFLSRDHPTINVPVAAPQPQVTPAQPLAFLPQDFTPNINALINPLAFDNSAMQRIIYDTISSQQPTLPYWATNSCIPTNNGIISNCYEKHMASENNHSHVVTLNDESKNALIAEHHSLGPPECNLFVMYLPQEYCDRDLAALFSHCGTVLSAKVFMDNLTNQSKCFGFVSYDNPESAQCAIDNFNGYKIGHKKLKVSIKQQKNATIHKTNNNNTNANNTSATTTTNSLNNNQS